MDPVRHILVPIDASPAARAALRYAVFLSRHYGATVDVLLVVEPEARLFCDRGGTAELLAGEAHLEEEERRSRHAMRSRAQALLNQLAPDLGHACRIRAVTGEPVQTIVNLCSSYYDTVVMGDEGEHGTHGHVVREVARLAPCGVIPIRSNDEKLGAGFCHGPAGPLPTHGRGPLHSLI